MYVSTAQAERHITRHASWARFAGGDPDQV